MEVDEGAAHGTTVAERAALAAARAYAEGVGKREMVSQQPVSNITGGSTSDQKVKTSVNSGVSGLFQQCSNAKLADRAVNVYSVSNECGYTFEKVPVPRIGCMTVENEADITSLFHGARQMRGNVIRNDVMTATFDPATLNCVTCSGPHEIMSSTGPSAIILSDQNFVPAISHETDTGCIAIVRLEDASLQDLADLAVEIFEKKSVGTGSVFLLGSASHLIKAGVAAYAGDWLSINRQLNGKFKNISICPLVPLLFEDSPGLLARDLEILAMWLHNVYGTGIRGMSVLWAGVAKHVLQNSTGHTELQYEDIVKVSLPVSLSSPDTETFFFKFPNSCPARLSKMDRKTTDELIRTLINQLQNNFTIAVCPEGILPRALSMIVDPKDSKHIVCIGSSIIKQTIPFLKALGYSVTDLSRPGWLATPDNITSLITQLADIKLAPGFAVVFDLLGNASHRYEQFDGTQSLPQKEGGRYHMPGPVVTCEQETYRKIVRTLGPVLLSAQDATKVSVPPLPRYIFSPCCNNSAHCTNLDKEGAAEKLLNGVSNLKSILKKECNNMKVRNHWILDGIGTLAGVPIGQTAGSNRDLLPELNDSLAVDGVHLSQSGYRKLAVAISGAIDGIRNGSLTKSLANTVTGTAKTNCYFWRGFSSPIGDDIGRAKNQKNRLQHSNNGWHQRQHKKYHPYNNRK
jgi:hypothetical protein